MVHTRNHIVWLVHKKNHICDWFIRTMILYNRFIWEVTCMYFINGHIVCQLLTFRRFLQMCSRLLQLKRRLKCSRIPLFVCIYVWDQLILFFKTNHLWYPVFVLLSLLIVLLRHILSIIVNALFSMSYNGGKLLYF